MTLRRSLIYTKRKKERDPEQTHEAAHVENFVFQSQINLLLQTAFCLGGRKKTNNWLYLLFYNVRVYETIYIYIYIYML